MIHLHVHCDEGSHLDATATTDGLPKRAKELGMSHVAITDHAYTTGWINFYESCLKEGVKPILGCEVYICDDRTVRDKDNKYYHLVLLAKDQKGLENLQELVSLGHLEGFYYKARIDKELLKKYGEGLIGLSACIGGEIPKTIQRVWDNKALMGEVYSQIEFYKGCLDEFYIELQAHDNPDQALMNLQLTKLAKEWGLPLVVTSDVHFTRREDYSLHGDFVRIAKNFEDNELYKDCWFKNEDEVYEVLTKQGIPMGTIMEAVMNTHIIAGKCTAELKLGHSYLPDFPVPEGMTMDELLKQKVNEGFYNRGLVKYLTKNELQVYIDRAFDEYQVMTKKGYSGYHLIVADFLDECRARNIYTGDGRGSADNSLICYLMGITNVDPILYDLDFGRYLTMDRTELPDIDMDIQSSKKQEALQIFRDKYGIDYVAQIANKMTFAGKSTIESLARVYDIKFEIVDKIKACIPDDMSIKECIEKGRFGDFYEKYQQYFDRACQIEGLTRGLSIHAGGVVVCPSNMKMSQFCALALSKEGDIITQYPKDNIERCGLVKIDALNTTCLDVIASTLDRVFGNE